MVRPPTSEPALAVGCWWPGAPGSTATAPAGAPVLAPSVGLVGATTLPSAKPAIRATTRPPTKTPSRMPARSAGAAAGAAFSCSMTSGIDAGQHVSGLVDRGSHLVEGQEGVTGDRRRAGGEVDGDVVHPRQRGQLGGDRADAVTAGHPGDLVRRPQ